MSVSTELTVNRHAEVRAVLADPRFVVPAAAPPPAGGDPGIAWLRSRVARFSTGSDHDRRRALASGELAALRPDALRERVAVRAAALLSAPGRRPLDLMGPARAMPIAVLAEALGFGDRAAGRSHHADPGPPGMSGIVDDVRAIARAYLAGGPADPASDAALARLVRACGGHPDEATAARIGLLAQACDATAGLIAHTVLALSRLPADVRDTVPTAAAVLETLRYDPPLRAMRRVAGVPAVVAGRQVDAGVPVRLDIAGANRDPDVFAEPHRFDPGRRDGDRCLTFGAGLRPCPGRDHAVALAVGVVGVVRSHQVVGAEVPTDPMAAIRIPTRLLVSVPC